MGRALMPCCNQAAPGCLSGAALRFSCLIRSRLARACLMGMIAALSFGSGSHISLASDRAAPPAQAHVGGIPEPDGYRMDDYRTPVPATLQGAKVITADDAEAMIAAGQAVFIDVFPRAPRPPNLPAGTVWRDAPHMSIAGSHWLPNVGYGTLSPEFDDYFQTRLRTLTAGSASKVIVFFCLKDCWMSWNAAKRALGWGYTNVVWFPDGTDGWQAIGNDLVQVDPLP